VEALFWTSAALIAYVYAGYPVLLAAWARLKGRLKPATTYAVRGVLLQPDPADLPRVSVVIAARDEGARLPSRIDNILASDYPQDRLEIIVASDGSTDDTAPALAPYADRVTLLMLPPTGKAGALNAAVREANHPIVVFADARQRFARDAIRRLVSHFADPEIGAVSGELMIQDDGSSTIGDGVGAYWNYEKWLRRHEAAVGSTIGVTGAIYAMRRWLWRPLPADTILDDVMAPMRIVLRGHRVIFDEHARAYDRAAKDAPAELRRKSRTLAGNFQLLAREPRLLVPIVNPVWLQFVSHKVGRLLVPYALVALFVASAVLARTSAMYAFAFAGQAFFYGLAVYGAVLDRRGRQRPVTAAEVFREAA
jgi:cellulose synthase/poly-beta-1,6-N-acetylglucosamine synthase-like glycosyltransferase